MKQRLFLAFFFLIFCQLISTAQQGWWVMLRDKPESGFNPYTYFDGKAIERRLLNGISLNDQSDWPVNANYSAEVAALSDSLLFESRWFNALAVYASEDQVLAIRQLPYVTEVIPGDCRQSQVASIQEYDTALAEDDHDLLKYQLLSMQGDQFQKAGIDGKGVRIAIFDIGFPGARENPAFSEIISSGRLIATKDFSKRKGEDVFWGKNHGTEVWSCIAGKIGDERIGLATGAEFLLAKTEVNREPFSEEVHWMKAAEWADQNGADIINSSLGYTNNRYFPWQMDGKTSFISRAANMAARKGILVVNAAGNEGDEDWQKVGAPADADSVLSIGGIDPETGYHTSFSSFGPTADKRMKPNVSAYGHVIAAAESGLVQTQGTSFASPLVAGFAACALQTRKSTTNMELFRMIQESATLYPYFDYAHGFGVPQASYFLRGSVKAAPSFEVNETADSVIVTVHKALIPEQDEDYSVEYKPFNKDRYFYYNLMNPAGVIDQYYVLDVTEEMVLSLDKNEFKGETLNMHFAGYTYSLQL